MLFFCDGGAANLDLKDAQGAVRGQWVNIGTGEWGETFERAGGAAQLIAAPGPGPWVAVLTAPPSPTPE